MIQEDKALRWQGHREFPLPSGTILQCNQEDKQTCYTLCFNRLSSDIELPWDAGVKGESESELHLMPESMVCRLDPLPLALSSNSYGIRDLPYWE